MSAEVHSNHELPAPGVANRPVSVVAAGLMLMMLGAVAGLFAFYVWQLPDRTLPPPRQLPAPQVRTDERLLRQQLEAGQRARLSGYRWENADRTLVGIPVERAMEILVARRTAAYDPLLQSPNTIGQSPGPGAAAAMQDPRASVPSNGQPAQTQ